MTTTETLQARCERLFALLAICLALLMAAPVQAGQGADTDVSPVRALQQAHWVAEGTAHPTHVIYVFVDPNCPYCHTLWLALQPYRHDGLQVRNILVGVISVSSPGKAAAIFSARDPAAAWRTNEVRWGSRSDGGGGIAPLAVIGAANREAILDNETLMRRFGILGTPGLVYVTADGKVHVIAGVPDKTTLTRIVHTATVPRG